MINLKSKFKYKTILLLFLTLFYGSNSYSQVTIGSSEPPIDGAILQLKNLESIAGGNANSTKGLLLPRVFIVDLQTLEGIETKAGEDPQIYTGLVVFNTNDAFELAPYVWSGTEWDNLFEAKTPEPEQPSLELDKNTAMLYDGHTQESILITVKASDANVIVDSDGGNTIATYVLTKGSDNTYTLNFTAKPDAYGNQTLTIKLDGTDVSQTITVSQLGLVTPDRPLRVGNDDASYYESATIVQALGGSEKWKVVTTGGNLSWETTPVNDNGSLKFQLNNATTTADVEGYIEVCHSDLPALKKRIDIVQNKENIKFPEYDFMTIKYSFKDGNNLDTYTELMNTGNDYIDGKAMAPKAEGYLPVYQDLEVDTGSGKIPIMKFGGEINTNSAPYEETLIYGEYLNKEILNDNSPMVYDINLYATWWNPENPSSRLVKVEIFLYKGGHMEVQNNTFVVIGGEKVYQGLLLDNYTVTSYRGNSESNVGGYRVHAQKLGHLEYEWRSNNCTYIPPQN